MVKAQVLLVAALAASATAFAPQQTPRTVRVRDVDGETTDMKITVLRTIPELREPYSHFSTIVPLMLTRT